MAVSHERRRRGFALVELIVVVVVLAILSSIAIVAYRAVTGNAEDKSAQATLTSFAREVSALGRLDATVSTQHVLDAGDDLTSSWELNEAADDVALNVRRIAWSVDSGAAGFATVSSSGSVVYGCAAVGFSATRIDRTPTLPADPASSFPCNADAYDVPTAEADGPAVWSVAAVPGNRSAIFSFNSAGDVVDYDAICVDPIQAGPRLRARHATAPADATTLVVTGIWPGGDFACTLTANLASGETLVSETFIVVAF